MQGPLKKRWREKMQEESPISVWKVSEQIRYIDEPKECSNCSADKTNDSKLFSDKAEYGASLFHVRDDWRSPGRGMGISFASY